MADADDLLNKDGVAQLIAKVPNEKLKAALKVVAEHLAEHGTEDRNEVTWGLFDDQDTGYGLVFGIYRF